MAKTLFDIMKYSQSSEKHCWQQECEVWNAAILPCPTCTVLQLWGGEAGWPLRHRYKFALPFRVAPYVCYCCSFGKHTFVYAIL